MARETHDLGRLFTHGMTIPTGGPRVEIGTSHEVEKPWRVGRSVVLKVWPTYAIVLGWWGAGRTREEVVAAELDAQAVDVPVDDIRDRFRPEPGHALLPEGWKVV